MRWRQQLKVDGSLDAEPQRRLMWQLAERAIAAAESDGDQEVVELLRRLRAAEKPNE
jgi:hypothetical protein